MSRYPGCPLFGPREEKDRSAALGGQRPPDDFRGVPAQGSAGSPPSWESAAAGRSNGWVALAGRRIRRLTYIKITPVYQFFYRKEPPVFDTFGQIARHGGQAQSWTKHNDFWRWPEVVTALRPQDDCKVARDLGSVSPELIEGQAGRIRRWFDKHTTNEFSWALQSSCLDQGDEDDFIAGGAYLSVRPATQPSRSRRSSASAASARARWSS